jgi:cytochrome P450
MAGVLELADEQGVVEDYAASPSGPLEDATGDWNLPPTPPLSPFIQTIRFGVRPLGFNFKSRKLLGEVFRVRILGREDSFVVTSHPDHAKALFTAKPGQAPSLTGESPLRPVVGPNSVLTSIGERHMRQRKLLLPPFHGEAVKRYVGVIEDAIARELEGWTPGEALALAPRMQAVTLDVIMAGVFGIEGRPAPDSPEGRLRTGIRRALAISTRPLWLLAELHNVGRDEPRGAMKVSLAYIDRLIYAAIDHRRQQGREDTGDVLGLLLAARDEQGRPLGDRELRDELLTLVLAGHETTANSLAWTFERLVRTPEPYARLREAVRDGSAEDAEAYVDATIYEGMRVRPVIPGVARRVTVPWRLGEYRVPANTPVAISIALLHHRPDVYPDPFAFRPERFLGRSPGTYTWIPFGGGIRRCLGASLAMIEQQIVLRRIAERVDLRAEDPQPEVARHRNVTMIPARGARVVVTAKR